MINNMITSYGTNPLIFVLIWFLSIPFYWYGWYLIGSAAWVERNKLSFYNLTHSRVLLRGILINRIAWISPYVYIMYSGKSLATWFWVSLISWLFVGLILFGNKLNKAEINVVSYWSFYAFFYDSLNFFTPYVNLLSKQIEYMDVDSKDVILDVGCGTGNALVNVNRYSKIIAIDNNKAMLDRATRKLKGRKNIDILQADLNLALPLIDNSVDTIICSNVFYAVQNSDFLISELARVLKPGGKLVMTNPISKEIGPIIIEHLTKSSFPQLLKSILVSPLLITIMLLNLIMNKQVSDGDIIFHDEKSMLRIINPKFKLLNKSYGYGGTNIVLKAERR
ncbi:class I SAM-dependent methyltransferase [bacterium]|nr:class I SAM-dependent methyltransferase [bacterium]